MVGAMSKTMMKKFFFCRGRQLFATNISHCICKRDRKSLTRVEKKKKAKSQCASWKTVSAMDKINELMLLKLQF